MSNEQKLMKRHAQFQLDKGKIVDAIIELMKCEREQDREENVIQLNRAVAAVELSKDPASLKKSLTEFGLIKLVAEEKK